MKILVTGGAGFIGSHLVDALTKRHQVIIIDNLSNGKKENLNSQAKFYKTDINSLKIFEIFKKEKPETVFHLAAQIDLRKSLENPIFDAKTNILGSLNIIEASRKIKAKKIIFPSTGGVYGQITKIPIPENIKPSPISPYPLAKLTIENYLKIYQQNFGLSYVILRLSNVYGPRQNFLTETGVIPIFINKILKNQKPIIYGSGEQTRDFLYVDDAVKAFLLAMQIKKSEIYNVGTGQEIKILQLLNLIKKNINSKVKPIHQAKMKGEIERNALDYKKIKKELGWQPKISLEEGIKKTIDWFKK
jgi:UDP-glucose 4-epimerase